MLLDPCTAPQIEAERTAGSGEHSLLPTISRFQKQSDQGRGSHKCSLKTEGRAEKGQE